MCRWGRVELTVLRARAVCSSCNSKLPPRTEAWWDDEERRVTCVTCERYRRLPTDPGPPPVAVPPPPLELDPSLARPLDRGDMGEGRVGQTLEESRIQGLEVLHGLQFSPAASPVDHLVVAVNGVWVVHAVPALEGRLERRDLGDWFDADPRLHIADEDRSALVTVVRGQVEAVTAVLAGSSFSDIPIRGVLCFGSVQPGWVSEPFVIDRISVTWRGRLVEPMLDPVLVDLRSRTALLHALAAAVLSTQVVAPPEGTTPTRPDGPSADSVPPRSGECGRE